MSLTGVGQGPFRSGTPVGERARSNSRNKLGTEHRKTALNTVIQALNKSLKGKDGIVLFAHQSCVRVTEGVKAIAPRHLDIQCPKQRSELSLEQQVLIPRRPIPRGEKQPQLVGMPCREKFSQLGARLR